MKLYESEHQELEGRNVRNRSRANYDCNDNKKQILELKEKIKVEKGHPVESQKLIFKGKTTNNEDTIEKIGFKDTDFLVVMTQVAVCQHQSRNHSPRAKLNKK